MIKGICGFQTLLCAISYMSLPINTPKTSWLISNLVLQWTVFSGGCWRLRKQSRATQTLLFII